MKSTDSSSTANITTMTSTVTSSTARTITMTSTADSSTPPTSTLSSTASSSTAHSVYTTSPPMSYITRATSKATPRTSELSSTTKPSQTTPRPTRPTACYLCDGPPFICETRYKANQCHTVDQQFCITTNRNNDDGTRSVFRSCATETECREANRSNSDSRCGNYDPGRLYLDNFQCSWCCNTALCNNASQMCITCSGTACNGNNLAPSQCLQGEDFCVSSFVDGADGSRNQTRSCVTEAECYRRWIQNTLNSPECMSVLLSGSGPSGQNLSCDFCCTRSGCNSVQFPPADTLYNNI